MDIFSTSKKDQVFLAWKNSYYTIWCMPLILRSFICQMNAFNVSIIGMFVNKEATSNDAIISSS